MDNNDDILLKQIGKLENAKRSYEDDYAVLEDTQIYVATISALLKNNHNAVAVDLKSAMSNFEDYMQSNLKNVPEAINIVSFNELEDSRSCWNKFRTLNLKLISDFNAIGKEIDNRQVEIAKEIKKCDTAIDRLRDGLSFSSGGHRF